MNVFRRIWDWVISIPKDKLLHACAGTLLVLYGFVLAFLGLAFWPSFIVGNAVAVAALWAKGVYDAFHGEGHSVEWADFAYGCLGVAAVDVALLLLAVVVA